MPRLKNHVPAYRRHRASGQAMVQIDGRVFYLGDYDSEGSRNAYYRLVTEWLANGRRLPHASDGAPGSQSVNELLVDYLRHAESKYVKHGRPTKEVTNIKLAIRPLKELYGETPVREFKPMALKAVREVMIQKGLVRRSINNHVGRIRRALKWGVENERVPPSILHGLQAVGGLRHGHPGVKESKPVRPAEDKAIEAVLKEVSRPIGAMIRLQRLTGMRPGEVCSMRMRNLDRTGEIWTYTPESHKTEHFGHTRVVHLGPKAQEVLQPLLKLDPAAFLFDPRDAVKERYEQAEGRSSVRKRRRRKRRPGRKPSNHYTSGSYARAVKRACERAEVEPWRPHQLRHSAGTDLRKNFDLDTAKAALGQRTTAAAEIYAELDLGKAAEAMAQIG